MTDPYTGDIAMISFNSPPGSDWEFCNGQLLNIAEFQDLYDVLGNTYGGDGLTTFALPDLRGRSPMHANNKYPLGRKVGRETETLTTAQIAAHTHKIAATTEGGSSSSPTGNVWADTGSFDPEFSALDPDTQMSVGMINQDGGGQAHNNMQPYLGLFYVIALRGQTPHKS